MADTKHVRRSVTLSARLAHEVERIAKERCLSDNQVLGVLKRSSKRKAFFALAERFRAAGDPREVKQLGDDMGRFIFGE